jgi:hypothetical protein
VTRAWQKTEVHLNQKKIEIWMVYNRLRVNRLNRLIWIGLLWTSSGRGNWNDIVWNSFAWVNQNAAFCTRVRNIRTLTSSHFPTSPQIHWNPDLDIFSSCLLNFVEIKSYVFILFEIFVFSYFLYWFKVSNTFLLCLFNDSFISSCIFSGSKLQCLGLLPLLF